MTKQWVHHFSDDVPGAETPEAARRLLGGKGASLRDMTHAGLHVPPGFTITTECCREYYTSGRKWPAGLADQVQAALRRLEQETGRVYGRSAKPLLVSVRSGAAASMPGMLDTLLNCGLHPALAAEMGNVAHFWDLYVQFILAFAKTVHGVEAAAFAEARPADGRTATDAVAEHHLRVFARLAGAPFPTDPDELLRQCVNAVFDSWENDRAVAYRRRNDIRGLDGTAVNVQAMFPSEVSGIVFTRDPNDLTANRMVIEASYGLGEAVVSGDVTPDCFYVRRDTMEIESRIGKKHTLVAALESVLHRDPHAPSLTPAQIHDLARLAMKVEAFFGYAVDVEFGFAEGRFALLQSRRVRGLDVAEDVEPARQAEVERLLAAQQPGEPRCWIAHNLSETLRFPTPLTWDVVRRFMSGAGGFGRLYRELGYRPSPRVCEQGFLDLICGRIYADPERLAELFWAGMPLAYDVNELLADRSLLDRAPTKFMPERADTAFLASLPANLAAMVRSGRRTRKRARTAKRHFEETVLPPYLRYVSEKRRQDLTSLLDGEVIAEFHDRRRRVLDEFAPESLLPGYFGGLALARLEQRLTQVMGAEAGRELVMALTRGLDGDTTFAQDALLHSVSQGETPIAEFLDRFGHRTVGEMELAIPRWREDPTYPRRIAERLMCARGRAPDEIHESSREERTEAEAELPEQLRRWGASSLLEPIRDEVTQAQELLPYRESGKHYLMMGYELIRLATEELARRWDIGGGIYFLQIPELDAYSADRPRFDDLIARRRIRWQALQRLDMPDTIDSRHIEGLGHTRRIEAASELSGTPISAGIATGPARIVFSPGETGDLGTDYVLVCPSTDPGWTPLFLNACALIVERGGVLSHGAIVARDFGIPAVVCERATALIQDGRFVRVDGNTGKVAILEKS
jgi:pyruvate,water dikinase